MYKTLFILYLIIRFYILLQSYFLLTYQPMIIKEVPNPGILGLLLFVSPVLYMYLNTLAFKNLKTPNPIKDKPLTIASIVKNGNNFDLDALDFYTNAIARFSAFYETQYLSLNKEKIQVYKHQVAGHTKEGIVKIYINESCFSGD